MSAGCCYLFRSYSAYRQAIGECGAFCSGVRVNWSCEASGGRLYRFQSCTAAKSSVEIERKASRGHVAEGVGGWWWVSSRQCTTRRCFEWCELRFGKLRRAIPCSEIWANQSRPNRTLYDPRCKPTDNLDLTISTRSKIASDQDGLPHEAFNCPAVMPISNVEAIPVYQLLCHPRIQTTDYSLDTVQESCDPPTSLRAQCSTRSYESSCLPCNREKSDLTSRAP
jgi:hypothetical protein